MSRAVPSDHDIIHALADDLPVGLWVARAPNGDFVYANRMFAEIMGQGGRDDVQAGGYSEPYGIFTRAGKPYPEARMPFVRALEERRLVVIDDLAIHRPDGTRVSIRAFARPVTDGDGAITHVVIAFFDVTREVEADRARAESEKRLHQGQRLEAIGTLAGGIAHDFNNLIFGIKLIAADLAIDEPAPDRKASLLLIDDITERSAMLTRSLLGFARRGKHRAMLFALDDVIEQMRELLTRTLVGLTVSFELGAADRGAMVGDPSQLEQIVMNLVVNARDALHDASGGRVVVATRTAADRLVLEVSDDGPGIPAELRERVFEPYFTTKTYGAERGTGLGLATVFGIVAAHGGTVEVADGLGGVGTTIRVQLPAAADAVEPARAASPAAIPAGTGTILVVDDDDMVLRGVGGALRSLGYETIEVTSGAQASEAYKREHEIRAVVLDLMMPEMSGKATFLALRELDPSVAVLVMSGHTINDDVESLFALGVRGFITKPYSPDTLARSLADAVKPRP